MPLRPARPVLVGRSAPIAFGLPSRTHHAGPRRRVVRRPGASRDPLPGRSPLGKTLVFVRIGGKCARGDRRHEIRILRPSSVDWPISHTCHGARPLQVAEICETSVSGRRIELSGGVHKRLCSLVLHGMIKWGMFSRVHRARSVLDVPVQVKSTTPLSENSPNGRFTPSTSAPSGLHAY